MILKQFYLNCLAHASYVVADEGGGVAAVVDPQRDVDQYLSFAKERDLRITQVYLTHFHADFIAGHLELRDRTGAAIYLGRAASAEYPFTPVGDGSIVSLGAIRITILETPGHTPESISLLIHDTSSSHDQPGVVLTGDTLFVGDVGRPDLRAALGWSASDLGGLLYDSLHGKLLALPDATVMYPAHGAGSLCGKALSKETVSTIGEQRRANYALRPMSKAAFIELVTADQPEAPAYFTYDAVLNSRDRPTLDQTLARELKPMSIVEVLAAQQRGAEVLDTREASVFAAAHLRGSLNIGLGGQYATWAGTILDPNRPLVIIADPGAETESALRLGRIGFDQVIGFLDGGLAAAAGAAAASSSREDEIVTSTVRLSPDVASQRMAQTTDALAIDVRSPAERAAVWIAGTTHIPLPALHASLASADRDAPILVFCAGGYRSSIAGSVLQRDGFTNVSELAGGLAAWESAGFPVTRAPVAGSSSPAPA